MLHFTDIQPSLQRRTVSEDFRDLVLRIYPGLINHRPYWALMCHLMFSAARCECSGEIMLSSETLASFEGKSNEILSRNYSGMKFLHEFWRDVLPFEVSEWSYAEGRVRTIKEVRWPEIISKKLGKEISLVRDPPTLRVYFITGESFSTKKTAVLRKLEVEMASTLEQTTSRNKELLEYFNGQNPHRFTKLLKNVSYADAAINKLPLERQNRERKLLTSLFDFAQPLYRPTLHSLRIFPFGENLLSLKREVRQAYTRDWVECDLRSAQLAIIAKLWDVPEVNEFLETGQSIWEYLANTLGLKLSPELKKALKNQFLYPLTFGRSKREMQSILTDVFEKHFGVSQAFETLFSLPLTRAIWRARAKQVRKYYKEHEVKTCFGDWLKLDYKNRSHVLSLLAQQAQAVELKLLLSVVRAAQQFPAEVILTAWQHDGFSLTSRKLD